jgi:hypothetical protein
VAFLLTAGAMLPRLEQGVLVVVGTAAAYLTVKGVLAYVGGGTGDRLGHVPHRPDSCSRHDACRNERRYAMLIA